MCVACVYLLLYLRAVVSLLWTLSIYASLRRVANCMLWSGSCPVFDSYYVTVYK